MRLDTHYTCIKSPQRIPICCCLNPLKKKTTKTPLNPHQFPLKSSCKTIKPPWKNPMSGSFWRLRRGWGRSDLLIRAQGNALRCDALLGGCIRTVLMVCRVQLSPSWTLFFVFFGWRIMIFWKIGDMWFNNVAKPIISHPQVWGLWNWVYP